MRAAASSRPRDRDLRIARASSAARSDWSFLRKARPISSSAADRRPRGVYLLLRPLDSTRYLAPRRLLRNDGHPRTALEPACRTLRMSVGGWWLFSRQTWRAIAV